MRCNQCGYVKMCFFAEVPSGIYELSLANLCMDCSFYKHIGIHQDDVKIFNKGNEHLDIKYPYNSPFCFSVFEGEE